MSWCLTGCSTSAARRPAAPEAEQRSRNESPTAEVAGHSIGRHDARTRLCGGGDRCWPRRLRSRCRARRRQIQDPRRPRLDRPRRSHPDRLSRGRDRQRIEADRPRTAPGSQRAGAHDRPPSRAPASPGISGDPQGRRSAHGKSYGTMARLGRSDIQRSKRRLRRLCLGLYTASRSLEMIDRLRDPVGDNVSADSIALVTRRVHTRGMSGFRP